ncbi:hypothetical protein AGENTSMITH_18 [Bacillus phage vB_BspM_AgentSmith]|nr:hypothetical protein AGENTSMITH_18 [Bacillus phage vB_BspM_AgentSmith]
MSNDNPEEIVTQVKVQRVMANAIPLSNILELSVSVIKKLAGSDMADTIGEQTLTREVLTNLVANRIKEKLL